MDGSRELFIHNLQCKSREKNCQSSTVVQVLVRCRECCGNESQTNGAQAIKVFLQKMTTNLFHGYPSVLWMVLSRVFTRYKRQRTMLEGMQILLFSPLNHFQGKWGEQAYPELSLVWARGVWRTDVKVGVVRVSQDQDSSTQLPVIKNASILLEYWYNCTMYGGIRSLDLSLAYSLTGYWSTSTHVL